MTLLRLLSFNIHGGYDLKGRRDLRRVHALLEEYNIDIAVFQEMETRLGRGGQAEDIHIVAGPERPYHLPGLTVKGDDGWYGNLIVSRYPIVRALVHNLETTRILEPRNAVDAFIDTPHGLIRVLGTHLSLASIVRWSEINNLVRLMKQVEQETICPLFFMGDLNEWRRPSKLFKFLDEHMTALPCGKTFPSFRPLFHLDRVWHDGPGVSARAQVLDTKDAKSLSDHLPVLVEITAL